MTVPPTGDQPDRPEQEPGKGPEVPAWAHRQAGSQLLSDERMARYFGSKWEVVYKRKLKPFFEDPSFLPTWNWSAALAMPLWFLYRKLYLPFAVFFLLPNFAFRLLTRSDTPLTLENMSKPENEWLVMMSLAVHVSSVIAAGGTANWLLFRRARAASQFVSTQQLPREEELSLLERMGGVNRLTTALVLSLMLLMGLFQSQA